MSGEQELPLVSAVIPTRNRPELVCRAVRGALAQTYANLEIIVVVDGPDPKTVEVLEALREPRLRVVALPENVGGSEARNIGVREAMGEWVAFLDDDDEWLPEKIERQIEAAQTLQGRSTFIACQYVCREPYGDRIWPTKDIKPLEKFSDYIFSRTGLWGETGHVQTSTWLISKPLLEEVPFTPGLKINQDTDWMLRAMNKQNVVFRLVTVPLAIFHSEQETGRVSKTRDWEFHYRWAMENRGYFSRRAMAFFLMTTCADTAAKQGKRLAASWKLLAAAFIHGSPTPRCLLLYVYYSAAPELLKGKLRMAIASLKERARHRIA